VARNCLFRPISAAIRNALNLPVPIQVNEGGESERHSPAAVGLGGTEKKTILFFQRVAEQRISLLITGNTHRNCAIVPYGSIDELGQLVRNQVLGLK